MRVYPTAMQTRLQQAQDGALAPVWFFWVRARNRTTGAAVTYGFWSGDEDISVYVAKPDDSGTELRNYTGGCGLNVSEIRYVAGLTDEPVSVGLNHLHTLVQNMVRGDDVRLAYCEIHATSWSGGVFASDPQLEWIGIIDEVTIETPSVSGDGEMTFSVRSEIMHQLTSINPAKTSDEHQKKRRSDDEFCIYSGVIGGREIEWHD